MVLVALLLFLVMLLGVNGGLSDLLERKRKQRDERDLLNKYPDYVLPQQNMKEEYGIEEYNRIVSHALGVDYSNNNKDDKNLVEYGVDVSYPIHQSKVTTTSSTGSTGSSSGESLLPNRQKFYDQQIQGCRNYYSTKSHRCDDNEYSRIAMNIQQPRTMQNYTVLGYEKMKAPAHVYRLLKQFWDVNKKQQQPNYHYYGEEEAWPAGNTYTNHWFSPTYMVDMGSGKYTGGGIPLRNRVYMELLPILSQWISGLEIQPVSLYGIRVYTEGSVLAPHVDRLPLVTSAIINIAQDVEEDWPLEVYGHDGIARNITMEPGDMILYESHSVIHGRPFALKGNYYANVFIHFEPIGHSQKHSERTNGNVETAGKLYRHAIQNYNKQKKNYKKDAECMTSNTCPSTTNNMETTKQKKMIPDYIPPYTEKETKWLQEKEAELIEEDKRPMMEYSTAHEAAKFGDLTYLKEVARSKKKNLFAKDSNGWQPIHEAVRGGHLDVVKFLIKEGANVDARTNAGRGGTPLYWAVKTHGESHIVSRYLKDHGAKNIGPDYKTD